MNWSYIAGFFDGEGCVTTPRRKKQGTTHITAHIVQSGQEGRAVLEAIRDFLRERGVNSSVYKFQPHRAVMRDGRVVGATKVIYRMDIQSRAGVVGFLRGVFPYLHVKKVIAQDVLRFMCLYPALTGRLSNFRTRSKSAAVGAQQLQASSRRRARRQ